MLNVNAAISSPMLSGKQFTVIRRSSTVDGNGRVKHSDQTIPNLSGVVHVSSGKEMAFEADYATGNKYILVHTKFRLYPQSTHALPDFVLWRGDRYKVNALDDYSPYGPGFVTAYCVNVKGQDTAPQG